MSELRQDPTTKEWVIIAPERTDRPHDVVRKDSTPVPDISREDCPFYPGNEDKTAAEVLRLPSLSQNSHWAVRVVSNLYPALTPEGDVLRAESGHFYRKRAGIGVHEVIIDTPLHHTVMAVMDYDQVEQVLSAYQQRYNTLKQNHLYKFITIFKNHGPTSGTSLAHPHSQLVATPVIASYYNRIFDIAHEHYVDVARCLYCDLLSEELNKGLRIVTETRQFVVFHPYASHVPYETWIIPKDHCASFGLLSPEGLSELAVVLKDSLLCLWQGLGDPDFNLIIDTATTEDEDDPYYHWHLRILPRLTTVAGFEMGSGIQINTALPEKTAEFIRQVHESSPDYPWLSIKRQE